MNTIPLPGCTPEPLMSYLKALGVFRLVAEQADPSARGGWRGGAFVLETALDRAALTAFFLEQYKPTPIVVPWSGGDFFGVNREVGPAKDLKDAPTATKIIQAVLATDTERLRHYRDVIGFVLDTMQRCGVKSKSDIEGASKKKVKADFIARLRADAPDAVVDWIDAAAQAEDDGTALNPLLGSGGGSDGNMHFSDNFMQSLWDCLPDFDGQRKTPDQPKPRIEHALFNDLHGKLVKRTGALYDSGAVGGPNATQGFLREFLVNPWNFILAVEGLPIFAGGMAKRHGSHSAEAPSFPYLIRMTASGSDFGSAALKENGQYEVWLPVWERAASLGEVRAFFREGRAQVGRRPAQTGVDMSRAVSTKGVSAGIDEFHRYGLIRGRVGGENYFTATSVGRYRVRYDKSVTLLDELDAWLVRFAFALRDEATPARCRSAFRRLDSVITDHCRLGQQPGQRGLLLPVLAAIGATERTLAGCLAYCTEKHIKPLQGLSAQWLDQADDGSPEFALAAAVAGIGPAGEVGPLRAFLEEVAASGAFVNWSPGSTSAVWSKRPLADNLAAVFRRRQMEAFRAGHAGVPLGSKRPAPLGAVLAFLSRETDDEKLHDLIWGLSALDWRGGSDVTVPPPSDEAVPFEFGVPRLLVERAAITFDAGRERWTYTRTEDDANAKPEPDVFHALASGSVEAVTRCADRAARRLKSGGLLVAGYRNRYRAGESLAVASAVQPERLLAAMLFPLSNLDLARVADSVLFAPETQE